MARSRSPCRRSASAGSSRPRLAWKNAAARRARPRGAAPAFACRRKSSSAGPRLRCAVPRAVFSVLRTPPLAVMLARVERWLERVPRPRRRQGEHEQRPLPEPVGASENGSPIVPFVPVRGPFCGAAKPVTDGLCATCRRVQVYSTTTVGVCTVTGMPMSGGPSITTFLARDPPSPCAIRAARQGGEDLMSRRITPRAGAAASVRLVFMLLYRARADNAAVRWRVDGPGCERASTC